MRLMLVVVKNSTSKVDWKNYLYNLVNRVPVLVLPPIPKDPSDNLTDWFLDSASVFTSLQDELLLFHSRRVERLKDMPKKAKDLFWWPFTQHDLVPENSITVIDSRCAESFSIYKVLFRSTYCYLDCGLFANEAKVYYICMQLLHITPRMLGWVNKRRSFDFW